MASTIPKYGPSLAQAWGEAFIDEDERPMAIESARWRHSWAAECDRRTAYRLLKIEPSDPLGLADHWRFGIGHAVHDRLQEVLQKAFPGCTVEVVCSLLDGLTAGHADVMIEHQPLNDGNVGDTDLVFRTVMEVKSINGFAFKRAIGARGPAEGPRRGALIQGALNAKALDADEMVIVYLSLENLPPREMRKLNTGDIGRFCAEWTYGREEIDELALPELERVQRVIALVDDAKLPARTIPDPELPYGAVITDPLGGRFLVYSDAGDVVDSGTTWHCHYCPFQARCASDLEIERAS